MANLETWRQDHKLPASRRKRLPGKLKEQWEAIHKWYKEQDMPTILETMFPRHGQKRKADSASDWAHE
jgi:hypothetical protein